MTTKTAKRKTSKLYVGHPVKGGPYQVFRSTTTPTQKTHRDRFSFAIGPFRTKAAADLMAKYGKGNPHMQTVAQVEKLAKSGMK